MASCFARINEFESPPLKSVNVRNDNLPGSHRILTVPVALVSAKISGSVGRVGRGQ